MIFNSKSFAVIGAAREHDKVGHVIFKNLLSKGIKTFPVNPKANEILGYKCYKNVSEINEKIDCVIIAIKHEFVPAVLEESGIKGIKNAVIISAGFSETGDTKLENDISKICDKYKMDLIGPNTLGYINPYLSINASFFEGMPEKGKIAFLSQSGAIGTAILDMKIPLSGFVSLGNMTNMDFSEFIDYFSKDKNTEVIALYMESLNKGKGKRFIESCRKSKKPIVVLKAGKTELGKKVASTHTAALASEEGIYEGIFKQLKLIEVDSIKQLFLVSKILAENKNIGKKACIITNAGGLGVLSSDYCIKNNIEIPILPEKIKNRLNTFLHSGWSKGNPVDVLGDAKAEVYERTIKELQNEKFFDFFIVLLTPQYMTEPEKTAEAILKIKSKTVFACFMGGEKVEKARKNLSEKIIIFDDVKDMAEVLGKAVNPL
ncbi:MAG: CoA-binding protein [Candidatus Nanoarchaeia archaeon]|nr:CoA-binding protein [Candidatus Nanoarchaeia archaeon]